MKNYITRDKIHIAYNNNIRYNKVAVKSKIETRRKNNEEKTGWIVGRRIDGKHRVCRIRRSCGRYFRRVVLTSDESGRAGI